MRTLSIAYLLALLALAPLCAKAETNHATTLKKDFVKYAAALTSNDYATVVGFLHPKAIAAMGGRQRMLSGLRAATTSLRSSGMTIESIRMGKPSKPQTIRGTLVLLLPHTILVDAPKATIETESTLLCVSDDGGVRWLFADVGSLTPRQFFKMFPAIARAIALPKRKQPVIREKHRR